MKKHNELKDYPYAWVFNRADLAISPEDKAQIRPLTPVYAQQVWHNQVGQQCHDLERVEEEPWLSDDQCWPSQWEWAEAFESDEGPLPQPLHQFLNWDPQTLVFICYDDQHILETRYDVFQRNWKAFLFAADQALVCGRRRHEALWFVDEHKVRLGCRKA
ncbi:DUF2947 family protein [Ferrimonas gelatinilytica]|uniref:DUF2947 domain-containing protein n=1 Tax=Ferrimonas gelatinilytica TaxID=1255257 RepID=A0ABP9SC97_9GAMM